MNDIFVIVITALVSFFCTCWIYPFILRIAKEKNVVDNPDERKLQRVPVPVLGGLTVVFGVLSGLMCFSLFGEFEDIFPLLASIILILIVGLIDDMISLSAKIRFAVEILLVTYIVLVTGNQINDFYGLWGVHLIPNYVSLPLTVFACVGIINAINLIDGVDGYSSGYSMVACVLFAAMFYFLEKHFMVVLTIVVAVSLLPFFVHNVFGSKSKMFIGDSGTLSLGFLFSFFVINVLSAEGSEIYSDAKLGLVPFALSVLCVPVFDTLRVMSARMFRGKSPFSPDKTHLHHLFIELGYSHIGTTASIIFMNLLIVLSWFVSYKIGLSIDIQLYIVVALGVFVTFVFYPFMRKQIRKDTKIYHVMSRIGKMTRVQRKDFWLYIQNLVDKSSIKEM